MALRTAEQVEGLMAADATPLVALSNLAYLGFRGLEQWDAHFLEAVREALARDDLAAARTLLDPFTPKGTAAIVDLELRLLGQLLAHFQAVEARLVGLHEEESGLDGLLVISRSAIAIVFVGTTDLSDIMADVDTAHARFGDSDGAPGEAESQPLASCGEVGVHRGFWRQYSSCGVRKRILDAVRNQAEARPETKVFLTGHSLGAAISELCGLDVAQKCAQEVNVINFGAPRVGNRAFRQACREQRNLTVVRVKLDQDPITRVPSLGYWHVGQLVWIRGEAFEIFDEEPWEECIRAIPYACRCCAIITNFTNIQEHYTVEYLHALDRLWPLSASAAKATAAAAAAAVAAGSGSP